MRVLATLLAAAFLVSCTTPAPVIRPTPLPTREPNTLSVSVLLDLSGSRAPSGQPQRNAMQLWLDEVQARSSGVKLKVKFVDVASSDARVLVELRHAVIDDHADAVIVGTPAALDDTFAQAALTSGVPIILTLPVQEPMMTQGGRWIFALAPTPDTIARAMVDDILARGLRAPSLLVSDESPAAIAERAAFAAELGRRGFTAPSALVVSGSDTVGKMRGPVAVAKSVILAGAAGRYGDAIRSIPVSVDAPRVYLSYATETADVASLGAESALVTWPGSRYLATISVAPLGPRIAFVQGFTERSGAPSTLAATAYDALAFIEGAAELAPSELDPAHLRQRLETFTFAGVVTLYSFTPVRHVGFASDDLAYLRWNGDRNAPFLAPPPDEGAK